MDDGVQHGVFLAPWPRYRQYVDVTKIEEDLAARMQTQLRLRGGDLAEVAAKAGRKLPKHLHAEVAKIVEAAQMAENPKLVRLIDAKGVARADRKIRQFLDKQNPAAERRGEILDRIAAVSFVLVTVLIAVFFLLLSRGYFDAP